MAELTMDELNERIAYHWKALRLGDGWAHSWWVTHYERLKARAEALALHEAEVDRADGHEGLKGAERPWKG